MKKLLVVQIAGLGHDFFLKQNKVPKIGSLIFQPIRSVFPAVTCTVQASFRTGAFPESHGIVGNGFFSREFGRPYFWEQSAFLVEGVKIWDNFRKSGKTVGQLFWQQSIGDESDVILSPAPIHKHRGGMIQDCYSRPGNLYHTLKRKLGYSFDLKHYWGPLASLKSSQWISEATEEIMRTIAPDILLTYLPHLDYVLQKNEHSSSKATKAFNELKYLLEKLFLAAEECNYDILAYSDYAITPAVKAIFPNIILREKGFLALRTVKGMTYPDYYSSKAFAVVDHQIAHIIIKNENNIIPVKDLLYKLPGVARILDEMGKKDARINHQRAGELILVAEKDAWFAYPWWTNKVEAPDYATHIDIHNKPGYDPCELFYGKWPFSISTDNSRIKGSHGIIDASSNAIWASTLEFESAPEHIIGLSRGLKNLYLDRRFKH
ncbi:MAG: alkaline phosphatase family protein [Candidatus Brocadia sp.]|nr:alkaline phosphatase family protein [Candidatus Brocadia sp.]